MIRIRTTAPKGFWRCGRRFARGWQEFPDDTFSASELETLRAEPMLVVEQAGDPPAQAEAGTPPEGEPPEEPAIPEAVGEPKPKVKPEAKPKAKKG